MISHIIVVVESYFVFYMSQFSGIVKKPEEQLWPFDHMLSQKSSSNVIMKKIKGRAEVSISVHLERRMWEAGNNIHLQLHALKYLPSLC